MRQFRILGFIFLFQLLTIACEKTKAPIVNTPDIAISSATTLPQFEDYHVAKIFIGTPAKANLASHPDAKKIRTRLSKFSMDNTQYAGHYRIVEIGCGTQCVSIWAVDRIDGSIFFLFTASSGVAYRPDSHLIVKNDPAFFEEMLDTTTVTEVEDYMATYGAPEYWLEHEGKFEPISPKQVRVDPDSRKLVAMSQSYEEVDKASEANCGINGNIRNAGFSQEGKYFVLADAIDGFPLLPEARIFVVEVTSNECVSGGCQSLEGEFESDDDQNSVLKRLEKSTFLLRKNLGLTRPYEAERIVPNSFANGLVSYDIGEQTIEVLLQQKNIGDMGDRKSSLQLEVRAGNAVRKLDSIDKYRNNIVSYRLGDLYLSPNGKSIAIIVEMKYEILGHAQSTYCRYMSETFTLL